jgi:hypothetical protein
VTSRVGLVVAGHNAVRGDHMEILLFVSLMVGYGGGSDVGGFGGGGDGAGGGGGS